MALGKRSFITKEVLFQPFTYSVKIGSPYIVTIYKSVLLNLEGKLWATISHSDFAGTRNRDIKISIKMKPSMDFSIWRNIKWNGSSIVMNGTQVQIAECLVCKTERTLKRETGGVADVPTNCVSRNRPYRSKFMFEGERGRHVYTWKMTDSWRLRLLKANVLISGPEKKREF
jgi:hypothetical protein